MGPNHEAEAESGATWSENPLKQEGQHQEDVESHGLHGVEPDIAAEGRVSDNAQVESEEGHEAGVRDGPVEGNKRKDGIEEKTQTWELQEEVAAIV